MEQKDKIKTLEGKTVTFIEVLADNSIVLHTKDGLAVEITSDSRYIAGVSIPVLDFYVRGNKVGR